MGSLKALTFAGAIVAGFSQAASAADLLPPPPMAEAPVVAAAAEFSGWYLRGDVGVGISSLGKMRSSFDPTVAVPLFAYDRASLADSAILGVGVGYQFNNWARFDVTGEYRTQQAYRAVASYDQTSFTAPTVPTGGPGCIAGAKRCYDNYTGSVRSILMMANGYADLGTWNGLTPYVGAGVGVASHTVGALYDNGVGYTGGGFSREKTSNSFAWALMAGLGYTVTPNLKLELGYRYLNMGTANSGAIVCQPAGVAGCPSEVQKFKLAAHDIRLGMRWMLGGDTPVASPIYAPQPGPLVRKY